MNRKIRLYAAVTLVALFVAGCSGPCKKLDPVTAPVAGGGTADFTTYVAMGTSIGAGYQSGGLVYHHQLTCYPALFAGQVGAAYTYPAISDSGIPPLLTLRSLSGSPVIDTCSVRGTPTNTALATPYTNLCIPGAILSDVMSSTYYGRSGMFTIVLRGMGTVLQEATALAPTFISFEFGANEVLGAASQGSGTPLLDQFQFDYLLHVTLEAVQTALPNAKLALFNVPDVTSIPLVTTIKPYFTLPSGQRVHFLAGADTLTDADFVLLTASDTLAAGCGIPAIYGGAGTPLPGSVVLTATEAASLQAVVTAYNQSIREEATARGAALVDMYGLLHAAATTGIQVGGNRYTSAFLTGGLFSLDGAHPNDMGQGLLANTMIEAVNAKFNASIPYVSLPRVQTYGGYAVTPTLPGESVTGIPRVEGLQATLRDLLKTR